MTFKTFCVMPVFVGLLLADPALAQEAPVDSSIDQNASAPHIRPTLTVADFDTDRTGWMPPPHLGETLAELLTDRLVALGEYRIVDRAWLTSSPHQPRMSFDLVRERAERAGVDYLVAGAVTRFSNETRRRSGGGLLPVPLVGGLLQKSHVESVIGLTLRMIDVHTGEVVATATAQSGASDNTTKGGGLAVIHGVPVPLVVGGGSSASGFQDRLLDSAMQQAITAAADKIVGGRPGLKGQ